MQGDGVTGGLNLMEFFAVELKLQAAVRHNLVCLQPVAQQTYTALFCCVGTLGSL